MSEHLLAITSLVLALAAAGIYGLLAVRLGDRHVGPASQGASTAWQAWWGLLAASTLVGVIATSLSLLGVYTLQLGLIVMMINLILIFVALWALTYYLGFIVTGWQRSWLPLALFYVLSVAGWQLAIFESVPTGTMLSSGTATLVYQTPLTEHWLYGALFLMILLPIVFGGLAYAYLAIRAPSRIIRYRILLVSGSLIVWFGSSLVASAVGFSDATAWPIVSRLISLTAATTIYFAHFPPARVLRRLT